MAAGDFTASTANRVNIELNKLFIDPITQSEFDHPVDTAKALLENQKVMSTEILEGDRCVGVKAFYIKGANDLVVSKSTDCTLPTGTELETSSKNYTSGYITGASAKVLDEWCNSELTFAQLSAKAIQKAMSDIRKSLNNTTLIPALTAGAQANLDTGIDSTWDDTTNTPRIDVPETDFVWEKLGEFRAVAQNNDFMDDFIFISGRNFYQDWYNRNYRITDTRVDSAGEAFNEYNMFFDIRNLDATMTRKTTFAVDTGSYFFWNTVINTPTAVQVQERRWVYTIQDPVLMWNRNGVLTPVTYEVEYEKVCSSRETTLNTLNYTHTFYIKLLGGFSLAPTGVSSQTGVLEFAATAAV